MTTLMTTIRDDYDHHPTPPDVLDRWAHLDPALELPARELVRRVTSWDHVRGDAVLIPLQQLAVAGDREAARLIVYALSPRLAANTRRQCTTHRDEDLAELIGYLHEATVTPHRDVTATTSTCSSATPSAVASVVLRPAGTTDRPTAVPSAV